MGNKHSCIPKRLKQLKKRRKRLKVNREQIQEQIYGKLQNGLETDQNQDYFSLQAETCSAKVAEQNDQSDIENTLLYSPIKEWDRSGMKLEDLGKMIHCSKVKINRHSCKEINDRCLVLFQNHLLILSDDFHGFTYQGTLPLAGIFAHDVKRPSTASGQSHAFQITGPLLHPFTVYCSTKEEVKEWLYYLDKQREENFKVPGTTRVSTSRKLHCNSLGQHTQNEELKTLVLSQPIHGGDRTCISSLGNIIWISEAKLQHLPSQEKHNRLLVLFPTTLLILSQVDQALYYKGELPLNAITISERDTFDSNSSALLVEGKMINQIVVSCPSRTVYQNLIRHLNSTGITVHKSSPVITEYDAKHSVRSRDQFVDKGNPLSGTQGGKGSPGQVYGIFTFPQKPIEMISVSENLPALVAETEQLLSPDYSEPYTPPPSRFSGPADHLNLPSFAYKHKSSPLPVCGGSVKSPGRKLYSWSQPSPLSSTTSDNLLITGNRLSFGYAEPFAALKPDPALPGDEFSHKHLVNTHDPLIKREQSNNRTSVSHISRISPVSWQPASTTANHCSSHGECLSNPLSPTYAEPYMHFKLQPAPPAKPLWLQEPLARHNSSPLPAHGGDQKVSLRKTHALSQLPESNSCSFGRDRCSFADGLLDLPSIPLYAEPFSGAKKRLGPSPIQLSATDAVFKQNDLLDMGQWSNMQLPAEERPSLSSRTASESSSCTHMDGKPLNDPLSPTYAEPYHSFKLQPAPPTDCFIRDEVSRKGSSDFPVHCSKDDTSEYFAIMEVLDSYREEKEGSWYSDDSRFSFTSSEPTYAELESPHADTDYKFWDFKQQMIPHLSPATLRKLCQRGMIDSRLQGTLHRWS